MYDFKKSASAGLPSLPRLIVGEVRALVDCLMSIGYSSVGRLLFPKLAEMNYLIFCMKASVLSAKNNGILSRLPSMQRLRIE